MRIDKGAVDRTEASDMTSYAKVSRSQVPGDGPVGVIQRLM